MSDTSTHRVIQKAAAPVYLDYAATKPVDQRVAAIGAICRTKGVLSSGSVCTFASLEPSYVLRAMGPLWDMAQAGVDLNSIQWSGH